MQVTLSSVDVCLALNALLQQLSVSMMRCQESQEAKSIDLDQSVASRFSGSHYHLLFGGTLGLGALTESARQMADLRYSIKFRVCNNRLN